MDAVRDGLSLGFTGLMLLPLVVLTQVDPALMDLDRILPKNGFQCRWSHHRLLILGVVGYV